PPLVKQRELVDAMETARTARRTKLAEADALLAGLDQYLLDTLGLAPPPDTPRKSFAVNLGAVIGKRLDPPAYQPLISYAESHEIALRDLQELAEIGAHTLDKSTSDDELVPYIGLPECDLTEVREVVMRPYHEVRARSIVRPGDILFARIEPSVFNKKYVLTEDLRGNAFAYTSTEFYVVTPNPDQIETEYLYAMFFCSFVFAQTRGKTTGSSGRRRLDPEMFRTLRIPVPDMATQSVIAAETRRRRERARTLRAEAEQGWAEAKRWFEEQLLGPDA
ncbi:MAG: restriction endonuclease subunit S, partial [Gammaproteobacteria bacterium]